MGAIARGASEEGSTSGNSSASSRRSNAMATSEPRQEQSQQQQEPSKPGAITMSQFLLWKQRKDAEAATKEAEVARKRAEDLAAGRVRMTGRELFVHEPWVFDDSRFI